MIGAGATQMPGGPDTPQGNDHRYMWVELDPETLSAAFRLGSSVFAGLAVTTAGLVIAGVCEECALFRRSVARRRVRGSF